MASLPWVLTTGSRDTGLSPEVKGSYTESCGSPGGFPTSGRKSKKESLVHKRGGLQRPVLPSLCALPPPSLGSRAAKVRVAWPGALQASPLLHPWPVSSLGVPAQLWLPRAGSLLYIFKTSFYSS